MKLSNSPSLNDATNMLLRKKINKSKEFQASSWNDRPLTEGQLNYAAIDASVLVDMYNQIEWIPKRVVSKKINKKKCNDDFDAEIPVKILFGGVFLNAESKDKLIKKFGITHSKVYADHITIWYRPKEYQLRGMQIGKKIKIIINGIFKDKHLQVARCMINDVKFKDQVFHVTISSNVDPKKANDIKDDQWVNIEDFQLIGIISVKVEEVLDYLAGINDKFKNKILEFNEKGLVGQKLKFHPTDFTSADRAAVHKFTESYESRLKSESSGKKNNRRIILTVIKKDKLINNPDDIILSHANQDLSKKTKTRNKHKDKIKTTIIFYIYI